MNSRCPHCEKALAVPDEFAGRRVKCPSCRQEFRLPASTGVAAVPSAPVDRAPVDRPVPPPPASSAPVDAVQRVVSPPKPARASCPDCGEPLPAGATECPQCSGYSDRPKAKPSRPAPREGVCYIGIRRDDVELALAVEKRMRKFIETEQLGIDIAEEDEDPPEDLGPNDLVIAGKVTSCDYGSRAIRYWLTFIAMFGPGSCRLAVDTEIETAGGKTRRIAPRSRLWMGFLGGNSNTLMKQNIKVVSAAIAKGAARHATGNRFLNAQAYNGGYWSLGLGIFSLLPIIGVPFGLLGLSIGLVSFITISKRRLPRGKGVALTGIVLCFLGFLSTVGMVLLMDK